MATLEGAKKKYQGAMKVAYENDNYTTEYAAFLGVSKESIADADPVKSWKNKFDTEEDRAKRADNWAKKLKAAFGLIG